MADIANPRKEYRRLQMRAYREKNKEHVRVARRMWYVKNCLKLRLKAIAFRNKNPEKARERERLWYLANKDAVRQRRLKWLVKNRDKARASTRLWRSRNKREIQEYKRAYNFRNKELIKKAQRARRARRMAEDLRFAIYSGLRRRIYQAVKMQYGMKAHRTMSLLGCSIEDFRIFIESKFEPEMCWENWGKGHEKWHLDHIIPCALFDLTKSDHQKRCFHFSNYQPLWQAENLRKGAKYYVPTPSI